jgi:hypothetical protein
LQRPLAGQRAITTSVGMGDRLILVVAAPLG